jgi:hypothetical protein
MDPDPLTLCIELADVGGVTGAIAQANEPGSADSGPMVLYDVLQCDLHRCIEVSTIFLCETWKT